MPLSRAAALHAVCTFPGDSFSLEPWLLLLLLFTLVRTLALVSGRLNCIYYDFAACVQRGRSSAWPTP